MNQQLKLRLEHEGDGTGELFVEFEVNGFSGRSSAWFDLAKLKVHAEKFSQFPLPETGVVFVAGGFWDQDTAERILQEHVYISAYPIDSRGGVGLRVRLAVPNENSEFSEPLYSVSAEFRTEYEGIANFSKGLLSLVLGDNEEFTFDT